MRVLFLLMALPQRAEATTPAPTYVTSVPSSSLPPPPEMARSNKGKDFLVGGLYTGSALLISGDTATTGNVTVGDQGSLSFAVVPGSVTAVEIDLPFRIRAFNDFIDRDDSKRGVRVTTASDVVVYGMLILDDVLTYYYFQGQEQSNDGFVVLPTEALGTRYVVLSYESQGVEFNGKLILHNGRSILSVVAGEDDTVITVTPTVTVSENRPAGVPFQVELRALDHYRLETSERGADFSGTVVTSNRPVAVFAGGTCLDVPIVDKGDFSECSLLLSQLPPTDVWGTNFLTVPLAHRTRGDFFRVLASQDGTRVTLDGSAVASLDAGGFYELQNRTSASEISTSKPCLVIQLDQGDTPFQMLVTPTSLYLDAYTLATPPSSVNFTNFVNVAVRSADLAACLLDDSVAFTSAAVAPEMPIGLSGAYVGVQLSVSAGAHHLSCPTPFGAWLYGVEGTRTYGTAAGLALPLPFPPTPQPTTPAPSFAPTSTPAPTSTFAPTPRQSHVGRDFVLTSARMFVSGRRQTLFIGTATDAKAEGNVSFASFATAFDVVESFATSFAVAPGDVTAVDLPSEIGLDTNDRIFRNAAVRVTATSDVVVSALSWDPDGDGFLVFPTASLGTHYVALGYQARESDMSQNYASSTLMVVATEDATVITITTSATIILAVGTAGRAAGVPYDLTLDANDVYILQADDVLEDMSGTVVTSNRPVAVFSGASYAEVPTNTLTGSGLFEQVPPTDTWGSKWLTVPFATRSAGDIFRVLASQDDTQVSIDGAFVTTLGAAAFYEFELDSSSAHVVEATKPCLVAQYNKGRNADGAPTGPFQLFLTPVENFLASYALATPVFFQFDFPFFSSAFLNVAAKAEDLGACLIDGLPFSDFFTALGTLPVVGGDYAGAQLEVPVGAHHLECPSPFGAYVYLTGDYVGFGYPAGTVLQASS